MTLEEKLTQRLRQQAQSAAALGIPEPKRLFQAAERFGAAEALSGLFSRGRHRAGRASVEIGQGQ